MKSIYLLTIVAALSFSACVTTKKAPQEIFVVDMDTPKVELGDIEVQFDRLFSIGGLRKAKVAVSYFPQEDAVCLQYRSDLMTYYQFWSRGGRAAFTEALAQYNEDYDARILDRKERNAIKKYNVIQGYLIWQLHRFAIKAKANMNVELGYQFKDRSPYFTVNQREAVYIDPVGRDNNRDTQNITLFFTRAQADELTVLFDPQFLNGLSVQDAPPQLNERNIDRDYY